MKNKKGLVPALVIPFAIGIIALILVGAFLFSGTMRMILIGVGIFGGVIYLLGTVKSDKIKVISVIILIGVGVFFVFSSGFVQEVFGTSIYKANWGHICCREGAYQPLYIRYTDEVSLYKCNAYTDECRIKIHPDRDLGLAGKSVYYQICNLEGSDCTTKNRISFIGYSETTDHRLLYIDYGQSIKFSPLGWPNAGDWGFIKYEADYRKFYIEGVENGKVFVAKSCILDADLKNRVLAGGLNELSKIGGEPNNCQNYITDYILVATNTYSYDGEEVICQARDIYEIDTITLLDGSSRLMQGERIKSVECCPHEANCDSDTFTFGEEVIKDCDYSYQCPNGGEPVAVTGTSYVTYDCINNKCIMSGEFSVECTNNAICVDLLDKPNAVCVNFKCEIDDEWLGHCGDGVCDSVIGETPTSCPADCAKPLAECEWWEEEIPAGTVEDCGFLGWKKTVPFFSCETKTYETGCKIAPWIYIAGGIILLILLIVLVLVIPRRKTNNKKWKKKK